MYENSGGRDKGLRGVREQGGLVLAPAPRPGCAAGSSLGQSGGKAEMTQLGHFHKTSFNISHENEEKAQNPLMGKK